MKKIIIAASAATIALMIGLSAYSSSNHGSCSCTPCACQTCECSHCSSATCVNSACQVKK